MSCWVSAEKEWCRWGSPIWTKCMIIIAPTVKSRPHNSAHSYNRGFRRVLVSSSVSESRIIRVCLEAYTFYSTLKTKWSEFWIVVETTCSCLLQQISSNRKPTAGVPVSPVLRNYDGFCCATHCILMNTSPEIPGCLSDTVAASSVYSSISTSSLREEEGVTRSRIFGRLRAIFTRPRERWFTGSRGWWGDG